MVVKNTIPYIKNSLFSLKKEVSFPKSPLRYPGGKARAVDQILRLIPNTESLIASPFFGGGSIEIAAATLNINVIGFDTFQPLVDFWSELIKDPNKLAQAVEKYYPLAKEKFYELQKVVFLDSLESAAVFYVLNRASFGGSTLSGGMSPGHPRFTKGSIEYLRTFHVPNMSVSYGDFHNTIPKYREIFLYLDPPYLISNLLYGKNGNTHRDFDHIGLNNLLKKRNKWVLSYNDCQEIRELYKDFRILKPHWKYGMSSNKESRELLILSDDIPDLFGTDSYRQHSLFNSEMCD